MLTESLDLRLRPETPKPLNGTVYPVVKPELGRGVAEHLVQYLQGMMKFILRAYDHIGLEAPDVFDRDKLLVLQEISPEVLCVVQESHMKLAEIVEHLLETGSNPLHVYAEEVTLLALEHVGREIDAQELYTWIAPAAQKIFSPEDIHAALERLSMKRKIGGRTEINKNQKFIAPFRLYAAFRRI